MLHILIEKYPHFLGILEYHYLTVLTTNPITIVPMIPNVNTSILTQIISIKKIVEILIINHIIPIAWTLIRMVIPLF